MPALVGNLLIITPEVVVGLALGALLAAAGTVRLLHRHRFLLALPVGALSLLLLPAAAADAVNAHYQYLPRVADVVDLPTWPTAPVSELTATTPHRARPRPGGAVIELRLPGPVSGFGTHTAFVYLPPQYFTSPHRRFPVVYLLHGSPGAPIDWFRAGRAASAGLATARAGHPVILVAPRASRYWSDDSECVNRPRERIETYLTVDVPAAIDRALRTIGSRADRALIGNSAGGFCALNLGLRHRDVFAAIGDLSGFDHPTFDRGLAALFGPSRSLAATIAAQTPSQYARALPAAPLVHVWLDTGRADRQPERELHRMRALLTAAGEPTVFRDRPGGHDYGVWRPALAQCLLWIAAQLPADHSPAAAVATRPVSVVRPETG